MLKFLCMDSEQFKTQENMPNPQNQQAPQDMGDVEKEKESGSKLPFIITFIIFFIAIAAIAVIWFKGGFGDLINLNNQNAEVGEYDPKLIAIEDFGSSFEINDFDSSLTKANSLIDTYPEEAIGYLSLAVTYLQQASIFGETEPYVSQAEELIRKAMELDPSNNEAYRLMANVHELRFEFDEALEMFNKAIELDPNDDIALTGRGHLYYILGNDILAEADYKKALEANFNNAQTLVNLALLYMRTGQVQTIDVEEMLLRAVAIETNHGFLSEAYNALGVFYIVAGRFDDAISSFTTSISYNPEMVPAINGLAMSHINALYEARDNGDFESMEFHLIAAVDASADVLVKDEDFSRGFLTQGILDGFAQDYDAEQASYEAGIVAVETDTTLGMQEKIQVRKTFNDLLATF